MNYFIDVAFEAFTSALVNLLTRIFESFIGV